MPKVTMILTDRDVANTAKIREAANARSNAHAVSIALSLTSFIVGALQAGDELLLRNANGGFDKIVIPDIPALERDRREAHNSR